MKQGTTTIREALHGAVQRLASLPQASPRLEAELLLCDSGDFDRSRLLAWPEMELDAETVTRFEGLVRRRLSGEPIAYIRGHQAFWSLNLRVTPDALIPRPETELLVELALERLPADLPLTVADAGTGSGAIASALAKERARWTLIAIERTSGAARLARDNLQRHARGKAHVVRCDWLAPISDGSLHALIGNPPYIPNADPHLNRGDLRFEPRSALTSGPKGLEAIRDLATGGVTRLRRDGFIALEHGFDQGQAVRAILAGHRYERIETHRDLAGHDRATTAYHP